MSCVYLFKYLELYQTPKSFSTHDTECVCERERLLSLLCKDIERGNLYANQKMDLDKKFTVPALLSGISSN